MEGNGKMNGNGKVNGLYRLLGYGMDDIAVVPDKYFTNSRDNPRGVNVLIYMDEDLFENDDYSKHLAFELSRVPYYNVRLATTPNARYAKNANIVLNKFSDDNHDFLEELSGYDDGSRLIYDKSDVPYIRSDDCFRKFVGKLNRGLEDRLRDLKVG